ncbi:hypothetical protein DRE_06724 [Drechslerella stenobrocha 248]|uniref:Uncharacterized protein n=1 Tax=Drechslerella stenobrocha 248 TaxID=1043628 RepID=W7HWW3_9PEZI|nr:hypothetical protein DRE_06724 [Drechslerella stenobrocha 248]
MSVINLPEIVLSPELALHKEFYTQWHAIALVEPQQPRPGGMAPLADRNVGILQAIAVLLTTSPGEAVAVSAQTFSKRNVVTYACSPGTAAHAMDTNTFNAHQIYARRLAYAFDRAAQMPAQIAPDDKARILDDSMGLVIRGCKAKLLSRVRKLQETMKKVAYGNRGSGISGVDGEVPVDAASLEDYRNYQYASHLFPLFRLDAITEEQLEEFASGVMRCRTGRVVSNATRPVMNWLGSFAMFVIKFNAEKGVRGGGERGGQQGAYDGAEVLGGGLEEVHESLEESELVKDLYHIVTTCSAILKVQHVEMVVGDPGLWKRMVKLAEYAVALVRILEAVAGKKTELFVKEVCGPRKAHGWFPRDAHCMVSYYHDKFGGRKFTADQLYEVFRHPNNFPADRACRPYGMFNQVPFTVHPEITLSMYLTRSGHLCHRLERRGTKLRLGVSKPTCWLCGRWMLALNEAKGVVLLVGGGASQKNVKGWRVPDDAGQLVGGDAVEKANSKVFGMVAGMARTISYEVLKNYGLDASGMFFHRPPSGESGL